MACSRRYRRRVAKPGDLDTGFSSDGKRAIDFGGFDDARDVLIQPDGAIVVAGFGGVLDAPLLG
jgi:hypothetical protein